MSLLVALGDSPPPGFFQLPKATCFLTRDPFLRQHQAEASFKPSPGLSGASVIPLGSSEEPLISKPHELQTQFPSASNQASSRGLGMRVEVALGAIFCQCRWSGLMLPGPRPGSRLGGKWVGGAGAVDETRSLNRGICRRRSHPPWTQMHVGRESPYSQEKNNYLFGYTGSLH